MPPHVGEESVGLVPHPPAVDRGTVAKVATDKQFTIDDFRVIKPLGNGDMGTVFLVAARHSNAPYAMKVMKNEVLRARKNGHRAVTEREILSAVNHPFLPTLHSHFETEKHSFLIMNYCHGGDLNVLRQKQPEKSFSENACRFYVAEVLLAIEYLHARKIVYRDLKPENILVQSDGHIMLTDFDLSLDLSDRKWPDKPSSVSSFKDLTKKGRSKQVSPVNHVKAFFTCGSPMQLAKTGSKNYRSRITPEELCSYRKRGSGGQGSDGPAHSFVGTEEYVAPEIVWGRGHGLPVDWWTLGILLYELYYGKTPFKGANRKETFYNILCRRVEFPGPRSVLTNLIEQLLLKEPDERLGSKNGAEEIKSHAFFAGVHWECLQYMSRTPVVPTPFSLQEIESERRVKLETAGKVQGDWSFTQERKVSADDRVSGPMKLTNNENHEDQVDFSTEQSRGGSRDTSLGEDSEWQGSDASSRVESLSKTSIPREEVGSSLEESDIVARRLFDDVF